MKFKWVSLIFLLLLTMKTLSQPKAGDIFPDWSEGYLDIHHINTGKGESTFFILPDGTTMLVDAGATARSKPRVTDPKPDSSRTPGEWISRYILHMMDAVPERKLDYVLVTHFHDDHIGELYPGLKKSKSGNFILTGITEVGERVLFDKIIDRGWPHYDWPIHPKDDYVQNYIKFVEWSVDSKDVVAEQFQVGTNKQLVRQTIIKRLYLSPVNFHLQGFAE